MKAVMYGSGNIGRGFIGMLFSLSGYEVTFIDVAEELIASLNREKKYPVRIVSNEGFEDIEVLHVCGVNGNDCEATAAAIGEADIMATAVGVNVLKYIVPNLAAGIRKRMENGGKPLNIIICENLIDADKLLAKLIKEELSEEEKIWFDENVGLVEASIGRMVPVQTEEMKAGNPLRVCVEQAREVLGSISALEEGHPLYDYILPIYQLFLDGVSLREIRQFAEAFREKEQEAVI